MTTQEKKDFILSRRNWLRTKTGRWALRKATGDVADTVAFRWDFMTVVNGRVCYAVCKATGLPLKRVYELFPSGPARGACKLAGLPKPDGCV